LRLKLWHGNGPLPYVVVFEQMPAHAGRKVTANKVLRRDEHLFKPVFP
jgi:hypothetical protein